MKTTRTNTGIYKITKGNRTFQAEKTYDGQWMLCEFVESNVGSSPEQQYWNHFTDLKSCKIAVNQEC